MRRPDTEGNSLIGSSGRIGNGSDIIPGVRTLRGGGCGQDERSSVIGMNKAVRRGQYVNDGMDNEWANRTATTILHRQCRPMGEPFYPISGGGRRRSKSHSNVAKDATLEWATSRESNMRKRRGKLRRVKTNGEI